MINRIASLAAALFVALLAQPSYAKPPSWDTVNSGRGRFKVLRQFGSAAVLDVETGIIWDQSPSTTSRNWIDSQNHCATRTISNRMGWRLPTLQELTSIVDVTQSPTLPPDHPFTNADGIYWSATTSAADTNNAWIVDFDGAVSTNAKAGTNLAWCVRGGSGVETQ